MGDDLISERVRRASNEDRIQNEARRTVVRTVSERGLG